MKVCSPAEGLMVLCSSGTLGEDRTPTTLPLFLAISLVERVSADCCGLFQGGEGGGRDGDGP